MMNKIIILLLFIGCAPITNEGDPILNAPILSTLNPKPYNLEHVHWYDSQSNVIWIGANELIPAEIYTKKMPIGSSHIYYGMTMNNRYYLFRTIDIITLDYNDEVVYNIGLAEHIATWTNLNKWRL